MTKFRVTVVLTIVTDDVTYASNSRPIGRAAAGRPYARGECGARARLCNPPIAIDFAYIFALMSQYVAASGSRFLSRIDYDTVQANTNHCQGVAPWRYVSDGGGPEMAT